MIILAHLAHCFLLVAAITQGLLVAHKGHLLSS